MTSEREQRNITLTLQRNYGMAPDHKAYVEAENAKKNDWFRYCKDGRKVTGTREQVLSPCACDGK